MLYSVYHANCDWKVDFFNSYFGVLIQSCRQYIAEQLVSQSQCGGSGVSQLNQSMVERWNLALLDATATVQVKEAQLQQVTKYHHQIQALQDTLQELGEELDSLSL